MNGDNSKGTVLLPKTPGRTPKQSPEGKKGQYGFEVRLLYVFTDRRR